MQHDGIFVEGSMGGRTMAQVGAEHAVDEAAARVMMADSSKFCLGTDNKGASAGGSWKDAFKISCWKCSRWGHMTHTCPN